jgi:dethiobiotin synthetase
LVARTGLGTINHTLLSLNALRLKNIKITAVAMIGKQNTDNERSIAYYGGIKNIVHIPFMPNLNASRVDLVAKTKTAEFDELFAIAKRAWLKIAIDT